MFVVSPEMVFPAGLAYIEVSLFLVVFVSEELEVFFVEGELLLADFTLEGFYGF